jgi:hypothetical protein
LERHSLSDIMKNGRPDQLRQILALTGQSSRQPRSARMAGTA